MVMLAQLCDYVIGGDPDRDTIDLAVLDAATGAVRAHVSDSADGPGYARLLAWAREQAPGRRVWALEGTGSFAAGLAAALAEAGEDTVEVSGPRRSRGKAKNDRVDAIAAARTALGRERQAMPRAPGLREAMRQVLVTRQAVVASRTKAINELKSMIVTSPEQIRCQLRGLPLARLMDRIDHLASPAGSAIDLRTVILMLQSITARIRFLAGQAAALDPELADLIGQHPAGPVLLAEPGIGPVSAAQILISWSHRGRVRSEAAFASLAGAAPIEASSGKTTRHRLSRGGDRDLNRALHAIAITRMRCHPETRDYHAKRTAQGKTHREIRRSVKRALARRLYRLIQEATKPGQSEHSHELALAA